MAIKKLEHLKTRTLTSTTDDVKKLLENQLLKENPNCRENEKENIIKYYAQQLSLSIESCFNFTESLADAEVLLYNGGKLLTTISNTVTDVLATLEACELKGPLIKYLCYINEFKTIEADANIISNKTSIFVDSVEQMCSLLAYEFEKCFFDTKISLIDKKLYGVKKKLNSCEYVPGK